MSDLTSRVEEIATAMQASYQADIDLLTRRDKTNTARILELEAALSESRRPAAEAQGEWETLNGRLRYHMGRLTYMLDGVDIDIDLLRLPDDMRLQRRVVASEATGGGTDAIE